MSLWKDSFFVINFGYYVDYSFQLFPQFSSRDCSMLKKLAFYNNSDESLPIILGIPTNLLGVMKVQLLYGLGDLLIPSVDDLPPR